MAKKINTRAKNWYLYNAVYCLDCDFNGRVNKIFEKWELPLCNAKGKNISDYLNEFKKNHGESAVNRLTKDIIKLIYDFDLGINWFFPYFKFFLSEKELPIPNQSFLITSNEADCVKDKRIKLEICPYTTLEDIKNSWPEIKKLQKKVWPKAKQQKISKKTIENFLIWANDKGLKFNTTPTSKTMYDPVKGKDEIIKATDRNIVCKIWENEKDISLKTEKKRINNLRQIRKRNNKLIKP
ncbi:MAG: hypothetical protein WC682_05405 [Parcubacteria group bacterium]|jgi:hypothetical protein